ncbi:PREDICTED: heat shock 70 kDa protein-like [Amphimedon queenslandica]|uniref:Uncharacterized protein n=1 Tax=Amphimedon queenslandica TaxID=400682 RepID=A0A1X7U6V0_AMPQE|nr:PREDICTED: heat shock 70 kDa protein-like [Amphimedon queenslandica]|eukprot:XP_003388813.1 PREDICTED: heat shock 70 kDa protein-like [Amphimedon queenslandica]
MADTPPFDLFSSHDFTPPPLPPIDDEEEEQREGGAFDPTRKERDLFSSREEEKDSLHFDPGPSLLPTPPPPLPAPAPDPPTHVIGIDLGTTFSCVSVWENGHPVVIANKNGKRTTPSWVCFTKDMVFVGEAAFSKGSRHPTSAIYDAKRMIGRKLSDEAIQQSLKLWSFTVTEYRGGNCAIQLKPDVAPSGHTQVLCPEEISAYVLANMKQTAEDYLGCPVTRAVITVPAYFNDAQRQATIDAASIAGLKVERIINEPTSAALAYGIEKKSTETKAQTLLVYDLGGGTLDVTVLIVDGQVFEVRSTSGDTHLGGQDFDNNLVQFFMPQVKEQYDEDIRRNDKALKKLRDGCRSLKHDLSHSTEAAIEIDALVNGEDFESSLTRDQFNEINSDLFKRCLQPVDRALADAHLTPAGIDEVVLIGGSTRIPKIQELLADKFPGKPLSKRINPDEAVAMGAAIQGANLSQSIEEKNSRLSGITLMDVAPMSLGIELASGKMSTLIQRNTTIPYSHSRTYKNNEDYQTEATIEVFEGEEKTAKKNRLLGRFIVPGLPPRPRGQVEIPVAFSLDVNGVLEVSAYVKGEQGTKKSLVIKKDKGLLTEEEIKKRGKELQDWERKCRTNKIN